MKYALLIYQDAAFEESWEPASAEERAELYAKFERFPQRAAELGATILGGEELGVSATATTVRKADDDAEDGVVTDGPFAEVAEQLGGFFVVDAPDLDTALALAKALPATVVEVRPVVEPEEPGPAR